MNKLILIVLSLGHMATDINQGAVPIMLPYFRSEFHLSYSQLGFLVFVSNFSSSVLQPLFGLWSDRFGAKWLLPGGIFLAAAGISLAGFASSYAWLLAAVLVSGVGVASYHPEGSKTAHLVSGPKKATAMSWFSVGGNLGFGSGPVIAGVLLSAWGLRGSGWLLAIGGPTAILMWAALPWIGRDIEKRRQTVNLAATTPVSTASADVSSAGTTSAVTPPADAPAAATPPAPAAAAGAAGATGQAQWGSLFLLIAVVVIRSWTQMGISNYIPLYYVSYLHRNPAFATGLVSIFLISGAAGTLVGGPLSEHFGRKPVIVASMGLLIPLVYLLLHASGASITVLAALTGFVIVSTFAITVVFGQELLPGNVGVASGLLMGFAIGMGGLGVTALGWVADTWGVPMTLKVISALPVPGLVLALLLPGRLAAGKARHSAR
ncbi:MAG: MFS transporter [Firmicutes bacterium]|nr:MFS transporter [Bacillota bacterium]